MTLYFKLSGNHRSYVVYGWSDRSDKSFQSAIDDISYHMDEYTEFRQAIFMSACRIYHNYDPSNYQGFMLPNLNIKQFTFPHIGKQMLVIYTRYKGIQVDISRINLIWKQCIYILYYATAMQCYYDMIHAHFGISDSFYRFYNEYGYKPFVVEDLY